MKREELEMMFCTKISLEQEKFRKRILKLSPEEIFSRAYQIDSYVSIYELLLEMSQKLGEEMLKKLLVFPELLAFLYGRWLKQEDSHTEELKECLKENIKSLEEVYQKLQKQEEEEAA